MVRTTLMRQFTGKTVSNIAQEKVLVGHIQRLLTRGTPPIPVLVRKKLCGGNTWKSFRKELDYGIYTTSLSTLENVVPAQYRQSTKESRVCALL